MKLSIPNNLRYWGIFASGALCALAGASVLPYLPASHAESIPVQQRSDQLSITARTDAVVAAVERVAPSVVAITTEVPINNPFAWGVGQDQTSSEGSGVVIDPTGIVLTNAHVVDSATSIQATFSDESSYQAEVIGIALELDLAVLRLKDMKRTTAVDIGKSDDLLLGEKVIAIGNPFGLGHTVTTGVVSAVNRPLETDRRVYQDFIQTDASINPGNSGGPLVNILGELVGINTAIRPGAEGIGFAIPVDRAIKVAEDILNFGRVQRPWLGVDVTDVLFRLNGKKFVAPQVSWVYENTELLKGDVILQIDDRKVQGRGDLNAYLSSLNPNGKVQLEVWRDGSVQKVRLQTSVLSDAVVQQSLDKILGISVKSGRGAVFVSKVDPGGAFARHRLKVGDQIVAINGQRITTLEDFTTLLYNAKSDHRGSAFFTIRRGNSQGQIEMEI